MAHVNLRTILQNNAQFVELNPVKQNYKVGIQSSTPVKQNSMHGIVPALVVASNNSNISRTYQVGTFFVGSEILEHRLKILSQQYHHICS